jgi:hypothetical protein
MTLEMKSLAELERAGSQSAYANSARSRPFRMKLELKDVEEWIAMRRQEERLPSEAMHQSKTVAPEPAK